MEEQLALLVERGTLDELGVGQIRDVFSNLLFPGTSTLWSRARYALFVPWIYRRLELSGTEGRGSARRAREVQARLIRALRRGGDNAGMIGARASEPERMPDELVWNGLFLWGIRVRPGALSEYHRLLEVAGGSGSFDVPRGSAGEPLDGVSTSWWHAGLPPAPAGWLDTVDFTVSSSEAEFIRGRLEESHPASMLTAMLRGPLATPAEHPWEQADVIERLSPAMREAVDHGRVFSLGVNGAGLLYSLLVARARGADNRQELEDRLAEWQEVRLGPVRSELRRWDRLAESFWALVMSENPAVEDETRAFVDSWMRLAAGAEGLASSRSARRLIERRELRRKRGLARLSHSKALDNAREEAGTRLFTYRWQQACRIAGDLEPGLSGEGEG